MSTIKFILTVLTLTFSYYNCASQKVESTNKIASKIYQKHLNVINTYFELIETEKGYSDDADNNFNNSNSFLVGLTHLECDDYSFSGCEPSQENYDDWKAWYKLNKKKLYLDDDKVKINSEAIPLRKNPLKYYKKKLRLVKKSIKRKLFEDPEYSNSISFLINLSGIKNVTYVEEMGIDIPSPKEVLFFKTWLKENQNNLYWDVKTQTVKLHNLN